MNRLQQGNRLHILLNRQEANAWGLFGTKRQRRCGLMMIFLAVAGHNTANRVRISFHETHDGAEVIYAAVPKGAPFCVTLSPGALVLLLEQLAANRCDRTCLSSLYLSEGEYHLLITPLVINSMARHLCEEYGILCDDAAKIQRMEETADAVCRLDAIGKLGKILS